MVEEQPRRKPRIPLSPTELYYFKELKKLKQAQKLEAFKAGNFYKITNRVNIALVAFLSYCVLSMLILNYWHKTSIESVTVSYGPIGPDYRRSVSELRILTLSGDYLILNTDRLFDIPAKNQEIYMGKDFLFGKVLKGRLSFDERPFWCFETYARFTVCAFALGMGFFIYQVNKHLTVNGLLVAMALYVLASLYFVLV